jgi:exopolysaccharide production protein ExoQ
MAVTIFLYVPFIVYLFWMDLKRRENVSKELWIPFAWMFLAGSRPLSTWLNLRPQFANAQQFAEGSPLDATLYLCLIAASVFCLSRRKIPWGRLSALNAILLAYFLYSLSSLLWAEDPFTTFKRWIKDLGPPIMALMILTERRPIDAIGVIYRRLAYLWLPLSFIFIRYVPEFGRAFRPDGSMMFIGVGDQKNSLGLICLIAGIYGVWELIWAPQRNFWRDNKIGGLVLLALDLWLIRLSDSQTAIVCLIMATAVLGLGRMPFAYGRPQVLFWSLFGLGGSLLSLELMFNIKYEILLMLGRRPDLTNRADVWELLKRFEGNPLFGAGFMSFWSGARLEAIWAALGGDVHINQAHNGYLEQYYNLGYVGVGFILLIMAVGLGHVYRQMRVDPVLSILKLTFIICAIAYNYTEASFYGMNNMWIMLLLGCIAVPRREQDRVAASPLPGSARGVALKGFITRGLLRPKPPGDPAPEQAPLQAETAKPAGRRPARFWRGKRLNHQPS